MESLEDVAALLISDADDTDDPAKKTAYRLMERQAQDLNDHLRVRHTPADQLRLRGFWEKSVRYRFSIPY